MFTIIPPGALITRTEVFYGWVAAGVSVATVESGEVKFEEVHLSKGVEEDWDDKCWPPRRVKITIEFLETEE